MIIHAPSNITTQYGCRLHDARDGLRYRQRGHSFLFHASTQQKATPRYLLKLTTLEIETNDDTKLEMCPPQTVPAAGHLERIKNLLEDHAAVSSDGLDLSILESDVRSNNEVVDDMIAETNNIDPEHFYRDLPSRGRLLVQLDLHTNYEDIFLFPDLSRRHARPSRDLLRQSANVDEIEDDNCRALMWQWADM